MEKDIIISPAITSDGKYTTKEIELNNIVTVITQLTYEQFGHLLAIIQFQQRVSKLFFDDEKKFEKYSSESDKAVGEYLKIKEPTENDLKKCEKLIGRLLEEHCDMNGKSLVFEVAKRLCKNYQVKDVVAWTFTAYSIFENDIYDWMY